MHTLVLLRHGQSTWNLENRFTGWTDVGLTGQGVAEATQAGKLLRDGGYGFDICFTSYLKRALATLNIVLEEMDSMWLPVEKSWRLNERHYGALQGLNKAETAERHGAEQVQIWRRSFSTPPPPLEPDDPRHPARDPRYGLLPKAALPACESLADTIDRALPYWFDAIAPRILGGQKVLIAAHGNSLRALVKHLDGISDDDIVGLNIPTGIPLVYELDKELAPIRSFYLGDQAEAEARAKAVAEQAKAKG